MNLIEYPDSEMMMIDLANRIAGELGTCLLEHEWASLAVPGGTTPGPMFDALSAADLDWQRVHILLTDERLVPPDHPRSNERLVRERLLTGRAAAATFIRLVPVSGEDIDTLYESVERECPISILLLGMGSDMHTASLFPGSAELETALAPDAPPILKVTAPDAPEPRLTLTAPVLRDAMTVHVLITGEEKRTAISLARTLPPHKAPISAVLGTASVHWAP